jgi:AmmeMemoRadiSam system protein B
MRKQNSEKAPVLTGLFYPGKAEHLRSELERCFATGAAASPAPARREASPFGLIVPHAGYAYSGGVAAHAYAEVRGHEYDLVVLLGPSHYVYMQGVAYSSYTSWRTPLGSVPVATEFYANFHGPFHEDDTVFEEEHSLEVQLPFLQSVLAAGFRILPLLVGQNSGVQTEELVESLMQIARLPDTRVLFVSSTDLSHDHPYDAAVEMDTRLAEHVSRLDIEQLETEKTTRRIEACGMGGLLLTLRLARLLGKENAEILRLTNSGEVTGDKNSRIVGYLAAVIA